MVGFRFPVLLREVATFIRLNLAAIGPHRTLLTAHLVFSATSAALQAALLFIVAVVATFLAGTTDVGARAMLNWIGTWALKVDLYNAIAVGLGISVILISLAAVDAMVQSRLAAIANERARIDFLSAYLQANLQDRQRMHEGHFQQVLGEYCNNIASSVHHFLAFCSATISILMFIGAPALINPRVAVIELILVAGGCVYLIPVLQGHRQAAERRALANRKLGAESAQVARISREIAQFDAGASIFALMREQISDAATSTRRITFREALLPPVFQYSTAAFLLCGIAALAALYPGKHPSVAAGILLTLRLVGLGRQALFSIQKGSSLAAYVRAVSTETRQLEAARSQSGTVRLSGTRALVLDGVGFRYFEGETLFENVNLRVGFGETIAILGPSGQGKSTLCDLIVGLKTPTSGKVLIDDTPMFDLDRTWRASQVAYVPQDYRLIVGTVAENIRFFRTFSDAEVLAAARAAQIAEELLRLPEGLETVLESGMRDLSGGQRQRLVIARALIGKPSVLVMDEPSAALDAKSERALVGTLRGLKGKMALIVVTHRPAPLALCDRMYRLQEGKLEEAIAA